MSTSKPSILIISYSHASRDPRIYRQALYLRDSYQVTVAAYDSVGLEDVSDVIVKPSDLTKLNPITRKKRQAMLLARRYDRFNETEPLNIAFKTALENIDSPDLIIANEVNSAPLAAGLAERWKVPFIVDTHEYAPGQADNEWLWRLGHRGYQEHMCRQYLPRADHVFSVCQGIADLYEDNFGVRSELLMNCPDPEPDLAPTEVHPTHIKLIHHGSASRRRQIEQMILLMDELDERFTLDLILMKSDAAYYAELERMALSRDNVQMKPPVAMQDIAKELNVYDIGLLMFAPTTTNLKHVLPNKLFEYIQARIAVATWPSPEIVAISEKYRLGPISSTFFVSEMASELNSLTGEGLMRFKQNTQDAARDYNSKVTAEILRTAVAACLDRRTSK